MKELGVRLLAVAEAIPQCRTLADCGCDHGFVSIYAAKNGCAEIITASDINEGPLQNAKKEIAAEGLEGRIRTVLCDGLDGIAPHDCVVIAGMGGETIAEIISRAAWTKENCKLVLQAMTKLDFLRKYLYGEGFEITDEVFVRESGHMYSVISATFSGKTDFLPYEKYISRKGLSSPLAKEYADGVLSRLLRELESKSAAGVLSESEKSERELDIKSLSDVREML